MSGTSPDKVKTTPKGQNSAQGGNVSVPVKSQEKKSNRAVSLKDDPTLFGFDDDLIKRCQNNLTQCMESHIELEKVLSDTEISEEATKIVRTALVGQLNALVSSLEEAQKQYWEGRTLHTWNRDLIDKMIKQVKSTSEALQNEYSEETIGARKRGQSIEQKIAKKPIKAISDVVKESEAPLQLKYSWADMVEESLAREAKNVIESSKVSLVSVIRSRQGLSQENRVIIPGNLETELPRMFERVQIAAKLAGCDLVADPKVSIKLARKEVFGEDEEARAKVLESLYDEKGVPKAELLEIADLAVLIETMLEIPSMESLSVTGPGKVGLFHTVNLLMRIYCEQRFSTPIAAQRNWWKGGQTLRQTMRSRLASQLGGDDPANCLLNCFDILYRKFVRHVLLKGSPAAKLKLEEITSNLSKSLFVTGGGLFNNLLRSETRTRKVETNVPIARGGKVRKELREEKYLVKVRPGITEGPKTSYESAIYAKVNNALAKIEQQARNYDLSSKDYGSPNEWESSHRSWVEDLYQRTKFPSHLMVQRKQIIRANILARMNSSAPQQEGQAAGTNPLNRKISPAEWTSEQAHVINENEQAFNETSIKALNNMLGTSLNKEGLIALTEEEITSILCGNF